MTGVGMVFVKGKNDKNIPRILMSYTSIKKNVFKTKPSKAFAKKFIKEWKKANNWKKKKK